MSSAWVGPLHWIQWAGGYRHLNSPRVTVRSGGRSPPPGPSRAAAGRRSRPTVSPVDVMPEYVNWTVWYGLWPKIDG